MWTQVCGLLRDNVSLTSHHRPFHQRLGSLAVVAVGLFCLLAPSAADAKRKRRRAKHIRDIPVIKIDGAFSQNDKRWARDRVGGSNETLKKVGCVVTSVATLFKHFGVKATPKQLNRYLRKHKGYNKRGWLSWLKAERFTNAKMKFTYNGIFSERRLDYTLKKGIPVIIKTRSVRNSIHWMLVVGKSKGQYIVHDPLHKHGKPVKFRRVAKKIYQMRIYEPAQKTAMR